MARHTCTVESQVAQPAGYPVTTTVNGYVCAIVAGATGNYKLRRAIVGCRASTTVVSQQQTIVLVRQTARALTSGFTTGAFTPKDPRSFPSLSTGVDITTGTTFGTGPTVVASPVTLGRWTFNTQSLYD